jgi:succinate dehydrogenase / fumarate reductase cytochrome b subunit
MDRASRLFSATIGKKAVMAVTGVILYGFLIGHVAGNLQVFMGAEKINAYSEFLKHTPSLLWGTRVVLLVSVVLHVVAAVQLTILSRAARPIGYTRHASVQASFASRTMIWSGVAILVFVVFHLLHFTTGTVHGDFREGDVFHNMVSGFRVIPVAIGYIAAMALLGMHLYHGGWSMFQSLGLANATHTPRIKRAAAGFAILLGLAFISIPVGILFGYGTP